MPSLKFLTELPRPFARLGRRFAPKISTTMKRMMRSSGIPSEPNIGILQKIVRPETALIVPLFAAGLAYAQFTSAVSLVEVYATVTDALGRKPALRHDHALRRHRQVIRLAVHPDEASGAARDFGWLRSVQRDDGRGGDRPRAAQQRARVSGRDWQGAPARARGDRERHR